MYANKPYEIRAFYYKGTPKMNLLAKLQNQAQQITTEDKDFESFGPLTADTYPAKVRLAYMDTYASGAVFLGLELVLMVNGSEQRYKEQICMSTKDGKLTYTSKAGEVRALPGYQLVDTLCKVVALKPFFEMSSETKAIKLYSKETRKEEVKEREVLMELINKELMVGLITEKRDHYSKQGETITSNKIDKLFTITGHSLSEMIASGIDKEPEYITRWTKKNKGQVQDRTTQKSFHAASATANTAQASTATTSMFGL